jgi:stage IV sporulation protein FB
MPTTHFTAVDDCPARDVIALFQPEQYHMVLIVDREFRLRGSVTETDVWESLPEKGMTARIGDFL